MITTQTPRIAEAHRIAERRDALLRIQAELVRIAQDDKTSLFFVGTTNDTLAGDASVTAEVVQLMMAAQAPEMYNVLLTVVQTEIANSETQILDELDEERKPEEQ